MTEISYGALLDRLVPRLSGGISWGLDRTRRLLAAAGDPHTAYPTIHIGGTNGKGTVAAIVESVLRADGIRTGLYTSPHLVDYRERVRIEGRLIGEGELLAAARALWPAMEREPPSFFEAATVIAFLALARAEVEVAVIEVGMGGRLDSTNVIDPVVAAITNVAEDHAQHLGHDLPTIAGEKAGIMKRGVPVVTGVSEPELLEVLARRADEVGAPLHRVAPPEAVVGTRSVEATLDTGWGRLPLRLPLAGPHQALNLAVAVKVLDLLPDGLRPARRSVVDGVATTRWPGRLQHEMVDGVAWLFDVAHNAAGVESLLAALPHLAPRRPLVALVGVLGDKDWDRMLRPLFATVDRAVLAEPPSAPEDRRWEPERVLAALGAPAHVRAVRPFAAAVAAAARDARDGMVVCTGSVHTVGDAMSVLGIAPFPGDAGLPPGGGGP